MATIGLDKLYYAKITEDKDGNETYASPVQLAKAISADLSVELAEATLYADDGAAEIVKELRAGCEIIALEVSISGVVSQRVLAHRTCEIGLYLLEAHNRTAILSHIEVILTLGIYLIVVAAFEQLVERAATGAGNRSCEHDEQHRN